MSASWSSTEGLSTKKKTHEERQPQKPKVWKFLDTWASNLEEEEPTENTSNTKSQEVVLHGNFVETPQKATNKSPRTIHRRTR